MDSRDVDIAELRALVASLTKRVSELELALAKAQKDSSTSSKPPSSDIVKPKPKQKKPGRRKKRKRGGQPGHPQQLREPLPPERVDETIDYEIEEAEVRRLKLVLTGDFDIIQHIELPETPVHVTEHRLAVYQDAADQLYLPDCPELKGPIFGPRLLATIGWLKSMGHCSYSTTEAVDGRRVAGPCLARLLGQDLHRHDLRIAGWRVRRIDQGHSQARTTG